MRRDKVGWWTATLMYAGSNRMSAMRRMVPLTRNASREAGWHRTNGDLACRGGVPAHGGGLAHLPAGKTTSRSMFVTSGGHLAPEKADELAGDRGDDRLLRGLALGEAAELPAKVELGPPGPRDRLLRATRLALFHDRSDGRAVLVGPCGLAELGPQMGLTGLGDPSPAHHFAARVLRGHETAKAHARMSVVARAQRRQSQTSADNTRAPISVTPRYAARRPTASTKGPAVR